MKNSGTKSLERIPKWPTRSPFDFAHKNALRSGCLVVYQLGIRSKAVGTGGSYYDGSATALAADTLIDHRPEWVISYSVRIAEALIERTASKYYRIAADWLRRAKKAYTKLGKAADWRSYLGQLKAKYKRRPSLQEQLSQL